MTPDEQMHGGIELVQKMEVNDIGYRPEILRHGSQHEESG